MHRAGFPTIRIFEITLLPAGIFTVSTAKETPGKLAASHTGLPSPLLALVKRASPMITRVS